jgi:hypothetical protein
MDHFYTTILVIILFVLFFRSFIHKENFEPGVNPETKRDQLLSKLYSKSMIYKVEKNFLNMTEKLIPILKDDIRFLPYVDFLYRLNEYRNKQFPNSSSSCHTYLSNLFIDTMSLLEDAFQKKHQYFVESFNSKYESRRKQYIKKSDFTVLDFYILRLFVENEEYQKEACEKNSIKEVLEIRA